jgi:hypothetical protein
VVRLKEVSMVQVFVYTFQDINDIELCPMSIPLKPGAPTTPVKLHIYAQPAMGGHMDPLDARDAYTKLAKTFGLDVVPIAPFFTPAEDPGICGLNEDDMQNLGEMSTASLGDSGSNCDALVVDNHKKKYAGVRDCDK